MYNTNNIWSMTNNNFKLNINLLKKVNFYLLNKFQLDK
jgi:hypothetical protein